MKPKSIGIIGGAGPMAGVLLLERFFTLAGSQYGCSRDGDFPELMLLSFPFSEMLTDQMNGEEVQSELRECIDKLKRNGAGVLAIACNTLHAFLKEQVPELIHMPQVTAEEIPKGKVPLLLCTSTSRRFALHKRFFPCVYPSFEWQMQVDLIIDQILKGQRPLAELKKVITNQSESVIVLGCTELSLYARELTDLNKTIIDPLEIVAKQLLIRSFKEQLCF